MQVLKRIGFVVLASVCFACTVKAANYDYDSQLNKALHANKLVAIGDVHGSEHVVTRLIKYLDEPSNWQQLDDLVVEFGNARYQDLADQYLLSKQNISIDDVRHIWRDTLYFMAWQYDIYEQLVLKLKQLNSTREHKVRLVLAEPAMNWQTLSKEDWQKLERSRETGYLEAINQHVFAKQRRAILLFGAFHTFKQPVVISTQASPFNSVITLLEQQKPGSTYTVWPAMKNDGIASSYPADSLIPLSVNSSLNKPLASMSKRFATSNSISLADVVDAYYVLKNTDRNAPLSDAALNDLAWHKELKRRAEIVSPRSAKQIHSWLSQHN